MVNAVVHALFHTLRLDSHTVIVGHNGSRTCLEGVELALRIAGRRVLVAAPVVKHLGNVVNLSRRLHTPENKVIVLGSVKFLAESSCSGRQIVADHKQMADIVDAPKQINVKIRFKVGIEQRPAVHVHLVLVRVNHVCLRMLVDGLHHLVEGVGRKGIVVIRQHDKVSCRHIHGRVCIAGNSLVLS